MFYTLSSRLLVPPNTIFVTDHTTGYFVNVLPDWLTLILSLECYIAICIDWLYVHFTVRFDISVIKELIDWLIDWRTMTTNDWLYWRHWQVVLTGEGWAMTITSLWPLALFTRLNSKMSKPRHSRWPVCDVDLRLGNLLVNRRCAFSVKSMSFCA